MLDAPQQQGRLRLGQQLTVHMVVAVGFAENFEHDDGHAAQRKQGGHHDELHKILLPQKGRDPKRQPHGKETLYYHCQRAGHHEYPPAHHEAAVLQLAALESQRTQGRNGEHQHRASHQ